ncbi:hypothetical protein NQ015_07590 [Corynebacterium sp. 153RC1]|uniref:hypothetical protein n=1 Tax=unclassified Corynebacterium TaxID=2624378 RepID=UPI00211BEDB1|nr:MULTISPECIES: hypothetical protein [unclassified Corynebacterium]MCQ9352786.1 hypothetical protein [Corynebacterium sp. 209RC1]MCQ9354970.1 hypothetical protein [Corynebacterium sp. 1222RC1]MCQ9357231.1 hypothetical protein [Corynebacterium sp. 122RC1]MCQ9359406.1 hypothetical protein [Corynebacterium sp. 142RC1]MCQ9361628.1 hypothetical protein [Corynebacterium sp. 153RC1]
MNIFTELQLRSEAYLRPIVARNDRIQNGEVVQIQDDYGGFWLTAVDLNAPTNTLFDAIRIALHRPPLNQMLIASNGDLFDTSLVCHPLSRIPAVGNFLDMFPEFCVQLPDTKNAMFHVKHCNSTSVHFLPHERFHTVFAKGMAPIPGIPPQAPRRSFNDPVLLRASKKYPFIPYSLWEVTYRSLSNHADRAMALLCLPHFVGKQHYWSLLLEFLFLLRDHNSLKRAKREFHRLYKKHPNFPEFRFDVALKELEEAGLLEASQIPKDSPTELGHFTLWAVYRLFLFALPRLVKKEVWNEWMLNTALVNNGDILEALKLAHDLAKFSLKHQHKNTEDSRQSYGKPLPMSLIARSA